MIFAKTADKVLSGEKTQTRRPTREDDQVERGHITRCDELVVRILRVKRNGRILWEIGRTYAVQPSRTAKSVGRIELNKIRVDYLFAIRNHEAIAEGFSGRDEFSRVWKELYPDPGSFLWRVYVLEFELVKEKTE